MSLAPTDFDNEGFDQTSMDSLEIYVAPYAKDVIRFSSKVEPS